MFRSALTALALTVALPALAQTAPRPAPVAELARAVTIPFEQFTLPNGLRVVVHTDRKAPVVAVSVWYGVGSADEPRGKTGFAHLFEHLMYNGSENYDGEFFEPLEDVGATNYNGTTSFDRTNYFENVPTGALDRALFLEADRMGRLLPAITQAKLDNQRGVVQNEKRQGDNQPYGLVFYSLLRGVFPASHPYHHSPIGSMADLDAASLTDVQNWFRTHYGPNNAVLVLAGDIDAARARPLVAKYFGGIPRGPQPPALAAPIPRLAAPVRATMNDRVANPRIYFAWPTPAATDPTTTLLDVATTVFGGGASSRLYNALVRDEQLAVSVGSGLLEGELASAALVFVDVKPGVDAAIVERRVRELTAAFLREGPTPDEIGRVATRAVAGTVRGLEEVGGFGGKAVTLAEGTLYANDPGYYRTKLAQYAAATPASVAAAAREWMGRPEYFLSVQVGERGAAELALVGAAGARAGDTPPPAARTTDASKLPPVERSDTLAFPDVERGKLANGVEVVFARRAAVPVIELMASFDAGNAADPRDKLGTQSLMIALLDEGTQRRTGPQIVEEAERLGAQIGVSAGMDSTRATLSALTPNLAASLDLFADVVRNPAFAPDQIERLRAIQLAGIAQEESQPAGIAGRLLAPLIYGAAHPYGVPGSGTGTAAGVRAVTRADLTAFHQRWMRPDTMTLFVVGDTTLAAILPQLDRVLGDWRPTPGVAKGAKAFTAAPAPTASRIVLVDRPNSPQSYIAGGYPLGVKGTDDPITLSIANEVLGGSFTSRLNADLRESKGWSYGVRSAVPLVREQLPFTIRAPVQSDKTGPSITALVDGIRGYNGATPITGAELGRAINANVLSLPGDFETSGSVLGALENIALYGRPDDYYERLPARYRALDAAAVTKAAGVIDPARITWVVVGDAKVVRPQLDALGLPIEVRTP